MCHFRHTSSVRLVQFWVHMSGSQRPVASQKGATVPDGSTRALSEVPNSVPLVPRDITQSPTSTAPAPNPLIALSPLQSTSTLSFFLSRSHAHVRANFNITSADHKIGCTHTCLRSQQRPLRGPEPPQQQAADYPTPVKRTSTTYNSCLYIQTLIVNLSIFLCA